MEVSGTIPLISRTAEPEVLKSKMKKGELGVLIHGAGWVSTQHIETYRKNPYTRILAICSRTTESAEKRAAEAQLRGVNCYDRLDCALAHPGIDLVSICTPQHLHCDNVLAAAGTGKHLLIEKPIANSLEELRKMRDAVEAAGVQTVVSFVLRWNPLFQELKRLIAENQIGSPYYVETDYLSHNGSWWGGWADARKLERGVSALLVGGCHAVDALRWFSARGEFEAAEPTEVYSVSGGYRKGTNEEYNPITHTWNRYAPPMEYDGLEIALVKFNNGAIGKVSVNNDCILPYRFPIRIFGDRGTVFDQKIWSPEGDAEKVWRELSQPAPDSSDVTHHPFQGEIDHFVDCIRKGIQSHCNLQDAIKTHEIIFDAIESQKSGRPIRLPLL
jgi:predicted dehydrogenase